MKKSPVLNNILGAFSDGAVLFPLLALLSLKAGFSVIVVLFSTGIIYIVSSIVFRVPMAVQPLKSIAIAAITAGATFQEVRLSGFLLGMICFFLYLLKIDRLAKYVSKAMIHQLQVGLGVLLVLQGIKAFGGWVSLVDGFSGLFLLVASFVMVVFPEVYGVPILGLIATVGILMAVYLSKNNVSTKEILQVSPLIRPKLIIALLIPQIVLTLSNSVLATQNVCHRYFGVGATRVSVRRLLCSIGLGNVLVALVGGIPFCHGSGGVTAHVRGGSTQAWSTALMGGFLIVLALFQWMQGENTLIYPSGLVATLLVATGIFHLKLAAPTAVNPMGWVKLTSALLITFFTGNLLLVLGAALLFEFSEVLFRQVRSHHDFV